MILFSSYAYPIKKRGTMDEIGGRKNEQESPYLKKDGISFTSNTYGRLFP